MSHGGNRHTTKIKVGGKSKQSVQGHSDVTSQCVTGRISCSGKAKRPRLSAWVSTAVFGETTLWSENPLQPLLFTAAKPKLTEQHPPSLAVILLAQLLGKKLGQWQEWQPGRGLSLPHHLTSKPLPATWTWNAADSQLNTFAFFLDTKEYALDRFFPFPISFSLLSPSVPYPIFFFICSSCSCLQGLFLSCGIIWNFACAGRIAFL